MATLKPHSALDDLRKKAESSANKMQNISLFQLRVDPNQPRKLKIADMADDTPVPPRIRLEDAEKILMEPDSDDTAALVRLALNILQDGVRQPIVVTPLPGGLYRLVIGERRVTAAMLARNWTQEMSDDDLSRLGYTPRMGYDYDSIPAVISDDIASDERFRIQVAENMMRQDMSPEDIGRAWLKMIEDRLFPHVHAIAKHFGLDDARVQSQIDLVSMAGEAAELRAKGVTSVEVLGRLLSSLRVARENGSKPALYDAFITLWDRAVAASGTTPSARVILDAARAEVKRQKEPEAAQPKAAQPELVKTESAHQPEEAQSEPEADQPEEEDFARPDVSVALDDGAFDELAADAEERESTPGGDFSQAGIGKDIPRAPNAPRVDGPHKSTVWNIPAFDLPKDRGAQILARLGVNIDPETATAQDVIEALLNAAV